MVDVTCMYYIEEITYENDYTCSLPCSTKHNTLDELTFITEVLCLVTNIYWVKQLLATMK